MWEVVASILTLMLSMYWGAGLVMCPMLFAMYEFGTRWSELLFVPIFYSYPVVLFGLLYALDMQFFGTNPVSWIKGVLIIAALMSSVGVAVAVRTRRSKRLGS